MREIYLDANATTKVHPLVLERMLPFYKESFGNPSSIHKFGREAKKNMEKARAEVASLINTEYPEEIIFTSGGTESDNFAIRGVLDCIEGKSGHIITSSVEHPAVLNTCKRLEKAGFRVTYLNVDKYGMVNVDQLKESITRETVLITIMAANNETGTIMPVDEIAKVAQEKKVLFHTDAVQLVGKVPFDVKKINVPLASISAHKINGPKGVGALYVKKGTKVHPYLTGGHQEKNLRAGTENIPGIIGFGKACSILQETGEEKYSKVKELRDYFFSGIKERITDIDLNGHPERRVPNTLNISFRYLEGESIVLNLDMEKVAASTGSACTSGSLEPSHVLKSMGIGTERSQGAVRFSLGTFTTKEELDYVLDVLPPIIDRLRELSPLYEK